MATSASPLEPRPPGAVFLCRRGALYPVAIIHRRGAVAKRLERALCSANVVLRIALATGEG
ncbi:hypothetical protein CPT32_05365 [Rhizobium sophoriradicis]|nr:hypothetical protein CPT32_05365 [Rhizobium sophoriradicis]